MSRVFGKTAIAGYVTGNVQIYDELRSGCFCRARTLFDMFQTLRDTCLARNWGKSITRTMQKLITNYMYFFVFNFLSFTRSTFKNALLNFFFSRLRLLFVMRTSPRRVSLLSKPDEGMRCPTSKSKSHLKLFPISRGLNKGSRDFYLFLIIFSCDARRTWRKSVGEANKRGIFKFAQKIFAKGWY